MRKITLIVLLVFSFSILLGCAGMQYQKPGTAGNSNVGYCALMGAGIGGATGAATRLKKPLKNVLIGAIIGAIGGAIICDIIEKNARNAAIEAARTNRPVQYKTPDGQKVQAAPSSSVYHTPNGDCQDIVNEAWDADGTYLGKITRKVCRDGNGNLEVRT